MTRWTATVEKKHSLNLSSCSEGHNGRVGKSDGERREASVARDDRQPIRHAIDE